MAVTPEARPLFTWTPDCVIGALQVGTPPAQGPIDWLWKIRGRSALIPSGVRHGVLPTGAFQETAPSDLQSGSVFSVYVFGADGQFLGGAAEIVVP